MTLFEWKNVVVLMLVSMWEKAVQVHYYIIYNFCIPLIVSQPSLHGINIPIWSKCNMKIIFYHATTKNSNIYPREVPWFQTFERMEKNFVPRVQFLASLDKTFTFNPHPLISIFWEGGRNSITTDEGAILMKGW